ncbi:hypothetical protein I6A60_02450 [Frankia sp. AgB1.9]|uniref:DUF6036 family nucleotidyltransferase n=1 Tax=unclassified Frankia TaxID=2632575 RepID=UPI00193367F6|nr:MULTISPECIES: DUF6036 family nucleotidyltransferase [unclassified Frankia]MBL7488907.1 hypothetical protein [Frankia sp. AgW1.1]MBL7546746.1 hypothetical protein [Frankia sp. AgB1.9]MBL7621840.1 hypothetical protein [Frankia sp. AgB1.8]
MSGGYEFTAAEITDLLAKLDERLRARGASATVFIVGGAAIAVRSRQYLRQTEDIDAITRDEIVLHEARGLATEIGLPRNWLNGRASMWMPPVPEDALAPVTEPGLHITYATDEFLLATKLIAQRRKDARDILELAARAGLTDATADELEALIYRYYTDAGALEFIVDGTDTQTEVRLLADHAAQLLARGRSLDG